MSSQRKIDSDRANGAKSHGPVSEDGRKRSSINALKHGLTARTVILDNEDKDEYNAFLDAYLRDLNPSEPLKWTSSSKWSTPSGASDASA